jgi:hypothetical protein
VALDESTLSEDARAIKHEWTEEEKLVVSEQEQNYFDNCNLSAWVLKYSLDSAQQTWVPDNSWSVLINGTEDSYVYTGEEKEGYYKYSSSLNNIWLPTNKPQIGDIAYSASIKDD